MGGLAGYCRTGSQSGFWLASHMTRNHSRLLPQMLKVPARGVCFQLLATEADSLTLRHLVTSPADRAKRCCSASLVSRGDGEREQSPAGSARLLMDNSAQFP
jgi:hypothetical protein